MLVEFELLNDKAKTPERRTEGSSGYDIYATEDVTIGAERFKSVPTGLRMSMDPSMEAQIRPRSGLAVNHGLTVLNAIGTIDSDYRGEIKVLIINHSPSPYKIRAGDRIAQMVFAKVVHPSISTETFLSETDRSNGGFGHTG